MYKILSCVGGGARGLISAIILREIEQRTNKPVHSLFDYIVGTSTGALSILALTSPLNYTADDIVKFYIEESKRIFKPRTNNQLLNKILNLNSSKYSCEQRQEVFKRLLKNCCIQSALTNILITSYDTELRIPIFFTNDRNQVKYTKDYHKICKVKMYEAAMATSAAPTFFPPYRINTSSTFSGYYSLVDGGLFANNPTYLAVIDALANGYSYDELVVTSVGTGSLVKPFKYNEIINWGQLKWAAPIIDVLMDSQSNTVDIFTSKLLPNYYTFNCILNKASDAMDDASDENIELLIEQAKDLIIKENKNIDNLCYLLTK